MHANDRPWMTALEMQFAAMRFLREQPESDAGRLGLEMKHLRSAAAYNWCEDALNAVRIASRTVPDSTELREVTLEQQAGWWWFGESEGIPASALLWSKWKDGVLLSWYKLDEMSRPWARFTWGWPFGDSLSVMLRDHVQESPDEDTLRTDFDNVETLSRLFLAGCTWLTQRVVTTYSGHIERHRRKQLARDHHAPVPSDVRVVQLRRTETGYLEQSDSTGNTEWSCRWIVGGHWRNQPYKDHRQLIYILPYVKGPDDKPLKVPTHTVYQVNR